MTITGIRFRPDGLLGTAMANTDYDVQVVLGITSSSGFTVGSFSNNLALASSKANVVGSRSLDTGNLQATEVRTLSSSNTGPVGGPKAFDIFIPFTTSYLYNPALGNLFMDLTSFAPLAGVPTIVDADNDPSIPSNAGSGFALSGTPRTIGLVTQFEFVPAVAATPEPGSWLLFGGALAAIGAARRKRRASDPGEGTPEA